MYILTPRRTGSERAARLAQIDYQKVLKYIESGSRGSLHLIGTSLTKLPDQLKTVGGTLWLRESKIQYLPSNLNIVGGLDLEKSKITKLPDNLTVKYNIVLDQTQIDQIPNNLKIPGDLYLHNTPLSKKYTEQQIRQLIQDKGGYVKRKIYM